MSFISKIEKKYLVVIYLIISVLFISNGFTYDVYSQMSKRQLEHLKKTQKKKFPDEYSDLDGNNKATRSITDENINLVLEQSRQKHLQALILIQKGDTLGAAKFFQSALDNLNKIASLPNIESNEDFTDLAQTILDDYESKITDINKIGDDASIFVFKDKLFQEVDKIQTSEVKPGPEKKDTTRKFFTSPKTFTIPMDDNDIVNKSVSFLTANKTGRKFVTKVLERSARWMPMMRRIAALENMPEEIVYLSWFESGLDPNIVSPAKAVGLWQFLRETGKDYNMNKDDSYWLDERRDPEKSTRAAMRFLKDLYKELGDWHLAMAAYNCGLGCVKRAIKKSGKTNPTFWDIRSKLPKETAGYVPQYLAIVKVATNPEAYNFNLKEINFAKEYKYDLYSLTQPCNLKALAKAAGISVEELKEYNPELIQSITPPDKKSYYLKIPQGTEKTFAANYNALTQEEKMPYLAYKAEKGETPKQIAQRYNVSVSDMLALNNISNSKMKLPAGVDLKIPIGGDGFTDTDLADNDENSAPKAAPQIDENKYVYHTVLEGETLYSIAAKHGMRSADIRNLNDLAFDEDVIQVGQKLVIGEKKSKSGKSIPAADIAKSSKTAKASKYSKPSKVEEDEDIADNTPTKKAVTKKVSNKNADRDEETSTSKSRVQKHKVKKNETLAQIADDYGVTIASLKENNKIKKGKISAGQTLNIVTTEKSIAKKQDKADKSDKSRANASVHRVKSGESLNSISEQYGVTEEELRKWNPKTINGDVVIAGSRIKVYDDSPSKGSSTAKTKNGKKSKLSYTIKNGDNLSSIAKKYGVKVQDLLKNNKSLKEDRLKIGQKIKIQ